MTTYPYTITYTSHRNAYLKISGEEKVIFMIPQRYRADAKLLRQLFEKAEKMWKRYQSRPKIEKWNEQGIHLFGEYISWEEFLGYEAAQPTQANLEKKLKEILYEYAKEWLDILSARVGKNYRSLTIKKAKSKWGSCSHDQNIMLNLSLIFLPRENIQYVIAHEVAHLVEKNHSPAFWDIVKKLFPTYKQVRKSLKKIIIL